MKSRKLVTLLSLGLIPGILAGCGNKSTTPPHVHEYGNWVVDGDVHTKTCGDCDETVEGHTVSESHAWDEGTVTKAATHTAYGEKTYTCSVCGATKTEQTEKLAEHAFILQIEGDQYLATAATCTEPASYYYSCECGEHNDETFVAGAPLGHDVTELSIVNNPAKLSYEAFEEFNAAGLKLTGVCSRGDQVDVDMSEVTYEYVNGGNSFRAGETKVIAHYSNYAVDIPGITVAKTTASIEGAADLVVGCNKAPNFDAIISKYGNVAITVKDKNGDVVEDYSSLDMAHSPYTYEARLAGTSDFDEVVASHTITVQHDYSNNHCECGSAFAIENVTYEVATGSFNTSEATGDLVAEITAALANAEVSITNNDAGTYKPVTVEVNGESITFDVFVVSEVITTEARLAAVMDASTNDVSGYYVLGADLGTVTTTSGGSHENTTSVNFTLDGNGHKIDVISQQSKTGGIFGSCGKGATYHVTIKNLTIKSCVTGQYGMLGYSPCNAQGQSILFENVKIKVGKAYTNGLICATGIKSQMTFRNCRFDYNSKVHVCLFYIADSKYPTFENTVVVVSEGETTHAINRGQADTEFDSEYNSLIEGLTIKTNKYKVNYPVTADNFTLSVPFIKSTETNYQMWTRKFVTDEVLGDTNPKFKGQTSTYLANYSGAKFMFNTPVQVDEDTVYIHIKATVYIKDYDGSATSTNFRGYLSDTNSIQDYATKRPENINVKYNEWTDCYLTVDKYAINGVLEGFVLCCEAPGISAYESAFYISEISIQGYK